MAVNDLSFSIRPGMVTGFLKVQPDEAPKYPFGASQTEPHRNPGDG
jgi:hypothetical protein